VLCDGRRVLQIQIEREEEGLRFPDLELEQELKVHGKLKA